MYRHLKPVIFIISLLILSLTIFQPTFAIDSGSNHVTETVYFGNLKDDGSACGVFTFLNFVVDIFSIGVGILALIGITIVGIKYLTATGNAEKTKKARHRLFQIIIGIVAYALLYTGVQWLMPGGKLDFTEKCATMSNEELSKIKEEERRKELEERENQRKKEEENNNNNSSDKDKDKNKGKGEPSELGKKILKEMEITANIFERIGVVFNNPHCSATWGELYRSKRSCCSSYVFLTLKRMGLLSKANGNHFYFSNFGKTIIYKGKAKKELAKHFKVINGNDTIANLVKKGKLVPGDICGDGNNLAHTIMYVGKVGGTYRMHSFGSGKFSKKRNYNIKVSGSHKIGKILHAK